MSVHGEYSRALESLIVCVRALDWPDREIWLERLTSARVGSNPDLSTSARKSVETIRDLAEIQPASPRVAEASAHLLSHCQMILGTKE